MPEVDESAADDNWLSFDTSSDVDEEETFGDESTESFFETEEPEPVDDLAEPSWFE